MLEQPPAPEKMLGVLLALPATAAIPIILRYLAEWRARMDAEGSLPHGARASDAGG